MYIYIYKIKIKESIFITPVCGLRGISQPTKPPPLTAHFAVISLASSPLRAGVMMMFTLKRLQRGCHKI
jgi:hypothetical protein